MRETSSAAAVILVGGMGTRLRPLTLHRPKALMPVLNRPFLSYQFDLLKKAGVRDVVLAANPAFKKWKRDLQKICPRGLGLHFAFEPKPLGTGGAIRFGYERLKKIRKRNPDTIVVLNGDVLIDLDLKKVLGFHQKNRSDCTLTLVTVPEVSRFGLIRCGSKGRVKAFLEKPKGRKGSGSINAGVYVMERSILERIPSGKTLSVEREVFPSLLEGGFRIFGHLSKGYWNDIGTPLTYLQAHQDLLKQKRFWTEKRNLCIGKHSRIGRRTELRRMICLGPEVSIDQDCVVENSILMDHVRIGRGVSLNGVILGSRCRIGDYSILSEGTVFGDGTNVPPHTRT